jgi:hypothetical protein
MMRTVDCRLNTARYPQLSDSPLTSGQLPILSLVSDRRVTVREPGQPKVDLGERSQPQTVADKRRGRPGIITVLVTISILQPRSTDSPIRENAPRA